MIVESFDLKSISSQQMAFSNLLLCQSLCLSSSHLKLSHLRQIELPTEPHLSIKCSVGKYHFSVFIAPSALQSWLVQNGYTLSPLDLPTLLLEALIEKILSPSQATFKQLLGDFVVIESIHQKHTMTLEENMFCCEFTLNSPEEVLLIVQLDLQQLSKLITVFPSTQMNINSNLLLKLSLSIGNSQLTQREYASLNCGDVVFFDHCYFSKDQRICLSINNQPAWLAQLDNQKIKIESPWSKTMSEEQLTQPNAVFDLNTVQVALDFTLPSQTMSLPDVQNLKPGYVFESDCNPDSPILIKVNNQVIANGELVKVGEKLGIRILDIVGS